MCEKILLTRIRVDSDSLLLGFPNKLLIFRSYAVVTTMSVVGLRNRGIAKYHM